VPRGREILCCANKVRPFPDQVIVLKSSRRFLHRKHLHVAQARLNKQVCNKRHDPFPLRGGPSIRRRGARNARGSGWWRGWWCVRICSADARMNTVGQFTECRCCARQIECERDSLAIYTENLTPLQLIEQS